MPPPTESDHTPPEHGLLLAAAWAAGSARDAVNRALASPLDWTVVVELALQHRMAPALLAALEDADLARVPADLLAALRSHCQVLRAQTDALILELSELLDALDRISVGAVPFKGPPLGALLYGDPGLRSPGDLDLLVRVTDVGQVCAVLEARGYVDAALRPGLSRMNPTQQRMYEYVQCEHQFVRESDDLVVEPHWGLSQRALAIDLDYPAMLDRARRTTLGSRSILVLAPADLLLALCIHGAKHEWERLAWIRDVAALLAKHPDLDLAASVAMAREHGCARLLLLGLSVAHACGGAHLPPAIHRLIAEDPPTIALQRQVVASLFQPGRPTAHNGRVEAFRFRMRERWLDRLRYVGRTWLLPQRHHIDTVALPPFLGWAYFPLKCILDYAVWPVWRLVKRRARPADS